MRIGPCIERAKAAGLPRVDGASALALLKESAPSWSPAVFIYGLRDRGTAPRDITGVHDQVVDCDFRVVVFVKAGLNAETSDAEVDALRERIEKLFTGWVHPDADGRATAYAGHELLSLAGSTVAFECNFKTVRRIRCAVRQGDAL